jgi:hypothetical protein
MLAASQTTIDLLNQSQSVSMTNGCWIEYNMNSLIDGTSITAPDGVMTVTKTDPDTGYKYKPFEKLFPITSIIDPRRPKFAGIKYMIAKDPSLAKDGTSGVVDKYKTAANFTSRLYFSGSKIVYKYWVSPVAVGTSLSNCVLTATYPAAKTAVANKITVKFETSHSKPVNWKLKLVSLAGAESTIAENVAIPDINKGVMDFYWNGSAWTTTEFTSPSAGVNLSGLKLEISTIDTSGGYVGVIEIAPKYVIDISSRLVSMSIIKSASDQVSGLIPVGDVTSNSLSLDFNSYDKTYEYYDKTNAFNKDKINLYKDTIIRPFVKIGTEKINLGVFYTDSFSVTEFGDVSMNALDGAKELQYIKPPDILCDNMTSVAIIRRLLDSVGFTNYNFNLVTKDTTVITPYHWYTDPSKTVWEHIQDLCKDTQMIATFDESDVLQFYPRDYIFQKDKAANIKLRNRKIGSNLENISSISLENVPSVKAVKVIYTPQLTTAYGYSGAGTAENLYDAPVIMLGASAIINDILPTQPAYTNNSSETAALGIVSCEPVVISGLGAQQYTFNGYLVVQKEIIEYDAIEYSYTELDTSITKYKWMTSDSDVAKYQGLAKPNSFKPTNNYRIKSRNAFDILGPVSATYTQAMMNADMTHRVEDSSSGWDQQEWNSTTGVFTSSPGSMITTSIPAYDPEKVGDQKLLYNGVSRSMATIFAKDAIYVPSPDPAAPEKDSYIINKIYKIATTTADYNSSAEGAFVIGTNMYFPLIVDKNTKKPTGNQMTTAGLAFSLSANNQSGYLLSISTTQNNNGDKTYRDVNFYKIVAGKLVPLATSQKDTDGTIVTNINGGELYKVEIKALKVMNGTQENRVFKIYLNGKVIGVSDTSPIALTNKIGIASLQGTTSFDYVYTASITKEEFGKLDSFDAYQGFLSTNSAMVKTFSDFIFNKTNKATTAVWIKEFGPVARELRRIQGRYTNAPGYPIYPSIVQNTDVTLVGAALDPFTMDVFVMNNTGAFTELANGQEKSFIIVGAQVTPTDSFEYIDPKLTDIDKSEQIAFDSIWIQKESEAKALADWITGQWSKQQKVLSIETFINPLLQIGDIVEVSYPSNNLYSSEDVSPPTPAGKYVILSVENSYDDQTAPLTTIICRSIYFG